MGIKRVLATLVLMFAVFGVTHMLNYPGSLPHFRDATGGQKILDMQASSSADETYQRLEAMGDEGRRLYLRLIATVDILFPLAVLIFLVTLARFAAEHAKQKAAWRAMLVGLPVAYFGLDLLENLSALTMLSRYPERLDWIAGSIGYLTKGKRAFMMLAFSVPLLVLVFAEVNVRWRARRLRAAHPTA